MALQSFHHGIINNDQVIDFSRSAIDERLTTRAFQLLSPPSSIKSFIGPNGPFPSYELARQLARSIGTSFTLDTLLLGSTPLDNDQATCFADAIKTNPSLRVISINLRGAKGAEEVVKALEGRQTTNLSLSIDETSYSLINEVAQLLKSKKLQELTITGKTLISVDKIFEALKTNSSLRFLKLDGFFFTDALASLVAQVVKTNKTVQELLLSNSESFHDLMTEKGKRELEMAFQSNTSITRFSSKDACSEEISDIQSILEGNRR